MASTVPSGSLVVLTRDQIRDLWLRDYSLRNPSADVGKGTQPWIDASTFADSEVANYANATTIANSIDLATASGPRLLARGESLGLGPLRPAVGASGYVQVTTATGGGAIVAGDECIAPVTGLRYKCSETSVYYTGDWVPVVGIDTGPATNQPPGVVLQWTAPRPGVGSQAVVVEQSDGTGLTGGRDAETYAEYAERIRQAQSTPAASGNDAEYQAAVLATSGIAIQAAFTYPAILGPATMGVAFLMRPASSGASRLPNGAQLALVDAQLRGEMPADDSIFVCSVVANPVTVGMRVTWSAAASGWADLVPWPAYAAPSHRVVVSAATSALTFTLATADSDYTGVASPQVGQTIGVWDAGARKWRAKRILTVTGTGPWAITCDSTAQASDTSYTPAVGQPVSPWSDALDEVAAAALAYADTLGPGEQAATFYDAGLRQRRSPAPSVEWPSTLGNALAATVLGVRAVADAEVTDPDLPYACPVGTPGVSSYLTTIGDLAVYPA